MCVHGANCKGLVRVDVTAALEYRCLAIWSWALRPYLLSFVGMYLIPSVPKDLHDAKVYIFVYIYKYTHIMCV